MPRGVKTVTDELAKGGAMEQVAPGSAISPKFETLRAEYLVMKDHHDELKMLLHQHERAVSNIGVQIKMHDGDMAKLKAAIDKIVYEKVK